MHHPFASKLLGTMLIGCVLADTAGADVIDQQNDRPIGGGFTLNAGPIGQAFVPNLTSLNFVELMINDQSPNFGGGVNVAVNVRSGDIHGAVIGTSTSVLFADQASQPSPTPQLVRFLFPAELALAPGDSRRLSIPEKTLTAARSLEKPSGCCRSFRR